MAASGARPVFRYFPSAQRTWVGIVGRDAAWRPVWRWTSLWATSHPYDADLGGDVGGRVHAHVDVLADAAAAPMQGRGEQ